MGKEEYLIGEPAVAYLDLINKGNEPIEVIDQLDPSFGVVKIHIKSDKEVLFRPYIIADAVAHTTILKAGEKVSGALCSSRRPTCRLGPLCQPKR